MIKMIPKIVKYCFNFELTNEIAKLEEENKKLKTELNKLTHDRTEEKSLKNRIIRHKNPIVTLADDSDNILYCAVCWDSEDRIVQLFIDEEDKSFMCYHCNSHGFLQKN